MDRKHWIVPGLVLLIASPLRTLGQSQQPPASPAAVGTAEHLYLAPKNGQTPEQQWADRYACHDWAKTQSGFDPTKQTSGAAPEASAAAHAQYRRALSACLEGRGYAVSDAPPQAPVPTPIAPPAAAAAAAAEPAPAPSPWIRPELKYHPLTVHIDGGYTLTQGEAGRMLQNGPNIGLGLTWYPTASLPLALRVDGTLMRFRETTEALNLAAATAGAQNVFGHQRLYGGDADLQLNLRMGSHAREYFFGGVGRYRLQTSIHEVSYQYGVGCDFYCYEGYFPVFTTLERRTTDWLRAWNAGIGFEFALEDPATFFIEARYLRVGPSSSRLEFVPITVGLRF